MVKKGLMITGGIILIIGLLQIIRYGIPPYRELNEFGTGYLTGSVLLAIIGIVLIIIGRKIN